MRVRIDQAGKQQRVTEVLGRRVRRPGHRRLGADGGDASVGADQQRAVLDRRAFDRQDPPRRQPAGPHASAAYSAPGRSPP